MTDPHDTIDQLLHDHDPHHGGTSHEGIHGADHAVESPLVHAAHEPTHEPMSHLKPIQERTFVERCLKEEEKRAQPGKAKRHTKKSYAERVSKRAEFTIKGIINNVQQGTPAGNKELDEFSKRNHGEFPKRNHVESYQAKADKAHMDWDTVATPH